MHVLKHMKTVVDVYYRFAFIDVLYICTNNTPINYSILCVSHDDDGNKGDDDDDEFDLLTKNSTSSDSGPTLTNTFILEAKHETITRINS